MKQIIGNTFPIRHALTALGGKYDPQAMRWVVPDDREAEAISLLRNYHTPRQHRGYWARANGRSAVQMMQKAATSPQPAPATAEMNISEIAAKAREEAGGNADKAIGILAQRVWELELELRGQRKILEHYKAKAA